jgi:hypothetical protein
VEGNIDRLTAAQIQEICRYKDGAIATFANGGKYLRINAMWLFLSRHHVRNNSLLFLQIQGRFKPEELTPQAMSFQRVLGNNAACC